MFSFWLTADKQRLCLLSKRRDTIRTLVTARGSTILNVRGRDAIYNAERCLGPQTGNGCLAGGLFCPRSRHIIDSDLKLRILG